MQFADCEQALSADLREGAFKAAMRHGDEAMFDAMLQFFRTAELQEEKRRVLCALGHAGSAALLERTLHFVVSSEVRAQDTVFPIAHIALTPLGRKLAWEFLKQNYEEKFMNV